MSMSLIIGFTDDLHLDHISQGVPVLKDKTGIPHHYNMKKEECISVIKNISVTYQEFSIITIQCEGTYGSFH